LWQVLQLIRVALGISLVTMNLPLPMISWNPSLVWHRAQYFEYLELVLPLKCLDK
jgi:hypothetical protein